MHPSSHFGWTDEAAMLDFLARQSIATIFVPGPFVVHAPIMVAGTNRLLFHVAKRNRAAPHLDGARALLSCLGPNAYVSPDHYGTPDQVPTWNYLSVEAEGPLRRLDEPELVGLLDDLSQKEEERLAPKPLWSRAKMTPGRFEAMLGAIDGFVLTIEALRGNRKLGQNKSETERLAVAAAIEPASSDLAEAMRGA